MKINFLKNKKQIKKARKIYVEEEKIKLAKMNDTINSLIEVSGIKVALEYALFCNKGLK